MLKVNVPTLAVFGPSFDIFEESGAEKRGLLSVHRTSWSLCVVKHNIKIPDKSIIPCSLHVLGAHSCLLKAGVEPCLMCCILIVKTPTIKSNFFYHGKLDTDLLLMEEAVLIFQLHGPWNY